MENLSREKLLSEFQQFSKQEKYDKVVVYLHAMQKSDPNFILIYAMFLEVWSEGIEEELLDNMYKTILDITMIGKDYEQSWLNKILSQLQALKENTINESESQAIFDNIDAL